MRVGVVTFWKSKDNYGQHLQSYALQMYLKQLGHAPFLLRYDASLNRSHSPKGIFQHLKSILRSLKKYKSDRLNKQYEKIAGYEQRNLQGFLSDNMSLSDIYSREQLLESPPEADAYICGSDQIWSGFDMTYFLDFVPSGSKKIAYAPSIGGRKEFNENNKERIVQALKSFAAVSSRENSGVDLCKRYGRQDAIKMVDPTLLLSRSKYDSIRTKTELKRPYAFVYIIGNPTECSLDKVMDYIRNKNLDCVYVASQRQVDSYPKKYPTMGEWIDYIAKADIVITNSFHCTVFSLLYERPFISLALSGKLQRTNNRLNDLLSECHLLSQIVHNDIGVVCTDNLNFNYFISYKREQELNSKKFLVNALSE